MTFWLDPNSVDLDDPGSGFLGGRSVQIAAIKGESFKSLVALRFYENQGQYRGWLVWRDGSNSHQFDTGSTFVLSDGWQKITIGYRQDDWVAAWVNGTNVRSITGVTHYEDFGSVIEVSKTLDTDVTPTGSLRFDDVSFEMPRIGDLWVDAASGSLNGLLSQFGIAESRQGAAWDQGVYEGVTGTADIFSDGFESGGLGNGRTDPGPRKSQRPGSAVSLAAVPRC